MSDTTFTKDGLPFAAEILRSMLGEAQTDNRRLQQRIEKLENQF